MSIICTSSNVRVIFFNLSKPLHGAFEIGANLLVPVMWLEIDDINNTNYWHQGRGGSWIIFFGKVCLQPDLLRLSVLASLSHFGTLRLRELGALSRSRWCVDRSKPQVRRQGWERTSSRGGLRPLCYHCNPENFEFRELSLCSADSLWTLLSSVTCHEHLDI